MKKFRVVINGEGGGDVYSLIAVAEELQIDCAETGVKLKMMYLGDAKLYRQLLEANGISAHSVLSVGVLKKIIGFIQACWWMFWFMPNVILSNGGSSASIVTGVGRFYFIPFVFHERNAVPIARDPKIAKKAKYVALSYESSAKYFRSESIFTGVPVARHIISKKNQIDKPLAKQTLGFNATKPLIFVAGGANGSPSINSFIVQNLPYILQLGQVIHQTGRAYYEDVVNEFNNIADSIPEGLARYYKATEYIDDSLATALIGADLVISRTGPGTLAEIAIFGVPAVLIPASEVESPTQRYNASEHAKDGAAIVFEEENLLPNLVVSKIQELLSNPQKLEAMSEATLAQAHPNAASDLAKIVLEFKK